MTKLSEAEREELAILRAKPDVLNTLVDRFLMWPLPKSVRSDLCVTMDYEFPRSGTNLLSADEAKQMVDYLLAPTGGNRG